MPIRPENKKLYPDNWTEIVEQIRKRSGNHCEGCGLKNGAYGYRDLNGCFQELELIEAEAMAADGDKVLKIVLTTAHLDHNPENCNLDNLRHWCQKCHNGYDAPIRANRIKCRKRQEQEKSQMILNFGNVAPQGRADGHIF